MNISEIPESENVGEAFRKQFAAKDRKSEFLIKTRSIPIMSGRNFPSYQLYDYTKGRWCIP